MAIKDLARRWLGIEEKRESLELNVDDRRLAEVLGIDLDEISVKGKGALKIDTVYACVRIRSESVAKLPFKVYQEDDYGVRKHSKHHVAKLLRLRPNPFMSAYDFWKVTETQNCIYGNSFVNIEFDPRTGKPVALWPIDYNKVTIYVDDDTGLSNIMQPRSRLWYVVDLGYEQRKVPADEMLHFRGGLTLNGIVGLSPIDQLRASIENQGQANEFINRFYKQGLQVKGLIQYVGDLDEKAKRNFREKFESMSSGLNNAHRIALMPIGYKFEPIAITLEDAQFIENAQLTIRQIAAAFGIKMHQLNDLSRATYNNTTEQQKEFYTDTLQPILTGYEQESTYKLFLDEEIEDGFFIRANADAILRADIKSRYEAYKTAIQSGFKTPNEVRALEEDPPMEGGDVLIVNGNMVKLTEVGAAYRKGGDGAGQGEEGAGEGNPSTTNDD
ncbi:phage portal protein [Paenibacillus ginsengihumi]|uniref:phage portal protein n=1 Tax=Paenibacillus ginsengihumi TaxID=431596 RepID=UPI000477A6B0